MKKQRQKLNDSWASCKTPSRNLEARTTFTDDLAQAIRVGRGFRENATRDMASRIAKHGLWMFASDLERMSHGSDGAKEALTAAIFFACSERLRGSGFTKSMFSAMSQRHLTRALLWLPPRQRGELFRAHTAMHVSRTRWIAACAGALAVARICYPLLFLTDKVYLPEPFEDVSQKIDLIALFENDGGLCVQSKARLKRTFSTFHPILPEERDTCKNSSGSIASGFLSFAKRYPRSWIFASGHVGMMECDVGDIEGCTGLHRKLLTFVMRKIPGLADTHRTAS